MGKRQQRQRRREIAQRIAAEVRRRAEARAHAEAQKVARNERDALRRSKRVIQTTWPLVHQASDNRPSHRQPAPTPAKPLAWSCDDIVNADNLAAGGYMALRWGD
jgi:hypothetical protein